VLFSKVATYVATSTTISLWIFANLRLSFQILTIAFAIGFILFELVMILGFIYSLISLFKWHYQSEEWLYGKYLTPELSFMIMSIAAPILMGLLVSSSLIFTMFDTPLHTLNTVIPHTVYIDSAINFDLFGDFSVTSKVNWYRNSYYNINCELVRLAVLPSQDWYNSKLSLSSILSNDLPIATPGKVSNRLFKSFAEALISSSTVLVAVQMIKYGIVVSLPVTFAFGTISELITVATVYSGLTTDNNSIACGTTLGFLFSLLFSGKGTVEEPVSFAAHTPYPLPKVSSAKVYDGSVDDFPFDFDPFSPFKSERGTNAVMYLPRIEVESLPYSLPDLYFPILNFRNEVGTAEFDRK